MWSFQMVWFVLKYIDTVIKGRGGTYFLHSALCFREKIWVTTFLTCLMEKGKCDSSMNNCEHWLESSNADEIK